MYFLSLAEGPDSGFELVGLKWLPYLTRCQAKEITPFEVGDTSWQRSLDRLMSNPVLVCALRRINAFEVLADTLNLLTQHREELSKSGSALQRVMALTPEMTFRQAVLFFTEKDFVTSKPYFTIYNVLGYGVFGNSLHLDKGIHFYLFCYGTEKLNSLGLSSSDV